MIVTIFAVELLWIATAWPDGPTALSYAAVAVILFSPRGKQAFATAKTFTLGTTLGLALAAIVKFAVLPMCSDFVALCLVLCLVLAPLGALSMLSGRGPLFAFAAVNFGVGLGVENVMSYDTATLYNQLLAIFIGSSVGAISFLLIPPLSSREQAHRAIRFTLVDVGDLATGRMDIRRREWGSRVCRRLSDLLPQVETKLRFQLVDAWLLADELLRFRHLAQQFGLLASKQDSIMDAIACGNVATEIERLTQIDCRLATGPMDGERGPLLAMRLRGTIFMMLRLLAPVNSEYDFEVSA